MSEQKTEAEDPSLFRAFLKRCAQRFAQRRQEREREAIRKTMASRERLLELSDVAATGARAQKFLASEFWREDLAPFLESVAGVEPWRPKDQDPAPTERALTLFLYGSGEAAVVERIHSQLEEWVKRGEEATRVLEREAQKRAALDGV